MQIPLTKCFYEIFERISRRLVRSRIFLAISVGFLTGIFGLVISLLPFGIDIEQKVGLDILFKLRKSRVAPSEVVILTMDKASRKILNLPDKLEKWPRSLHADMIKRVTEKGAKIIAFDVFFGEAQDPEHDNLLAEAIKNAGNVILCESIENDIRSIEEGGIKTGELIIEKCLPPFSPFAKSALALAPFPLPKIPVKLTQYWKFKKSSGDVPTLPVVMFQVFALHLYDEFYQLLKQANPSQDIKLPSDKDLIIKKKGVEDLIKDIRAIFKRDPLIPRKMLETLENSKIESIDENKIPILKSLIRMYQGPDRAYLNFYGPPGSINTVSYYQIIQPQEKAFMNQNQIDFKGKAVFVGYSARKQEGQKKDGFYTVFSHSSGLHISGVEIAATAFMNLLEDMPIRPLSLLTYICVIFIWGMLIGILCRLFSSVNAVLVIIGLSLLYLFSAFYYFKTAGIWYPLVVPLFFQGPIAFFGTSLWKYFNTYKERQNIKRAFQYFIPTNIVDNLSENINCIKNYNQLTYGICLCTDIRDYTSLSETLTPKELSSLLNKYYEGVFKPIKDYGGTVSDIKGDSMLAVWATRISDIAFRENACHAALDILHEVHRFNQSCNNLHLSTRIGVHSGHLALCTVGGVNHYEYRPVGDIVNTVSRIEGLNKYLGTEILVSEDLLFQLDAFLTRKIGKFLLAGKAKPIIVHELICRLKDSTKEQLKLCEIFAKALSAFKRRSWDDAIVGFRELITTYEEDGPSVFYLKLCRRFRKTPPSKQEWDGLICINRK